MKREIIRPFLVWDQDLRSQVVLSAGIVLSDYSIVRGYTVSEEPYRVDFQSSGRHYTCALRDFLPRTQSVFAIEATGGLASAPDALRL